MTAFLAGAGGGSVHTLGYDDTLRTFDAGSQEYKGSAVSLSAQPRAIDNKGDLTAVATLKVGNFKRGSNNASSRLTH